MITTHSVRLSLGRIEGLAARIDGDMQLACDLQAGVLRYQAAAEAPVESGGLRQSIYVASPSGSDYAERKAAMGDAVAALFGAPEGARALSRAIPEAPAGPAPYANVGVIARQGAPINDGFTHNRSGNHIPANPFWARALGRAADGWPDLVRSVFAEGYHHGPPPR